jgi:hypothetical protein
MWKPGERLIIKIVGRDSPDHHQLLASGWLELPLQADVADTDVALVEPPLEPGEPPS